PQRQLLPSRRRCPIPTPHNVRQRSVFPAAQPTGRKPHSRCANQAQGPPRPRRVYPPSGGNGEHPFVRKSSIPKRILPQQSEETRSFLGSACALLPPSARQVVEIVSWGGRP